MQSFWYICKNIHVHWLTYTYCRKWLQVQPHTSYSVNKLILACNSNWLYIYSIQHDQKLHRVIKLHHSVNAHTVTLNRGSRPSYPVKAQSHYTAFPRCWHVVVKFLRVPWDRRKILKKSCTLFNIFTRWRCHGVLTATEAFLRSARGVLLGMLTRHVRCLQAATSDMRRDYWVGMYRYCSRVRLHGLSYSNLWEISGSLWSY
jgi:hypothetical protein